MFVRMFICLSKSMEFEGGWRRERRRERRRRKRRRRAGPQQRYKQTFVHIMEYSRAIKPDL